MRSETALQQCYCMNKTPFKEWKQNRKPETPVPTEGETVQAHVHLVVLSQVFPPKLSLLPK